MDNTNEAQVRILTIPVPVMSIVEKKVPITNQDVDDIMSSALDYIGYWAGSVTVEGECLGEFISDHISRGGTLCIRTFDDNKEHWLDLDRFLEGFKLWVSADMDVYDAVSPEGVDCGNIDGPGADAIIQFALFADLRYG